jgi:hypothetical protein
MGNPRRMEQLWAGTANYKGANRLKQTNTVAYTSNLSDLPLFLMTSTS